MLIYNVMLKKYMIQKPLISIIIPVYKVERYIRKCLDSVLNQTYSNLQIILVDDGSPDECGKICDEYALKDSRIEVIHKENGGQSEARNYGLKKAKGEYIGFIDSDDYITPDMFEHLYNLVVDNNADMSICNVYIVPEENEKDMFEKNSRSGIKILTKLEAMDEILLDRNIQSYPVNKLYKREVFEKVIFPVGKKYEDIATTILFVEQCDKIVLSDEPKYFYLNRASGTVNTIKPSTILDYTNIIMERFDYIDKKYPELRKNNTYYLIKTLITAYNDMCNLDSENIEVINKINELYEKVKPLMKDRENEIIDIFDIEQKMRLYMLFYNPLIYIKAQKNNLFNF